MVKVAPAGSVSWLALDEQTRDDVVFSVVDITGEDWEDVKAGLLNGPAKLPLVMVKPASIFRKSWSVGLTDDVVKAYADYWRDKNEFPPVVIDSSRRPPLLEGRHRTTSAVKARVKEIVAIDLAGIHVMKTRDGLETYGFQGDP